jgi:hypothetical protein
MKTLLLSGAAVAALVASSAAQGPIVPAAIKVNKVQFSLVKTPDFQITGGVNKRSKPADWLEMEVDFDTKVDDIDELTFKYTVQVDKVLLEGEVTHVSIPKGREHYSVMYVAPRTLEKILDGKTPGPSSIENVWVEVSRQGQILGRTQHRQAPLPFAPLYFDRYEAIKRVK